MGFGTKRNRRRARIRTIESSLASSCLESTKASVSKLSIVGEKSLKKMEEWVDGLVESPLTPSNRQRKNLFRYNNYSPREAIVTWDDLDQVTREGIVRTFLEEGAGSVEEADINWGAWLSDQSSWTRKVIRALRDQGPFFPAGCLAKWPRNQDAGDYRNPSCLSVIPMTCWEYVVREIQDGSFSWDIRKLRETRFSVPYYSSQRSYFGNVYDHIEAKYIFEEVPMMALGETIIIGENRDNFYFIRAAKFLAKTIESNQAWEILQRRTGAGINTMTSTKPGRRSKKVKELIQAGKTEPVFILWNAFSGMPQISGYRKVAGGRTAAKGFPTIIRKPAQLRINNKKKDKEKSPSGLKFIFPHDGRRLDVELHHQVWSYVKDNVTLEEDLYEESKKWLLCLDKETCDSWRRDSGDHLSYKQEEQGK